MSQAKCQAGKVPKHVFDNQGISEAHKWSGESSRKTLRIAAAAQCDVLQEWDRRGIAILIDERSPESVLMEYLGHNVFPCAKDQTQWPIERCSAGFGLGRGMDVNQHPAFSN